MTERSAWHDNVRVVGICLVVAGHWGLARGFYPGVSDPSGDMIWVRLLCRELAGAVL